MKMFIRQTGLAISVAILLGASVYILAAVRGAAQRASASTQLYTMAMATANARDTVTWKTFTYDSRHRSIAPRAHSIAPPTPPTTVAFSIQYPPDWTARTQEDTGSDLGTIDLIPPGGSLVHLSAEPLRLGGFTSDNIVTNDRKYMDRSTLDTVSLSIGSGRRVIGIMNSLNNGPDIGKTWEVIYIEHGGSVYRAWLLLQGNEDYRPTFERIVSTIRFL